MNKDEMMMKLSSSQFCMWELHMYLDTHPMDSQAMSLYRRYENKTKQLKDDYEKMYGPLTYGSVEDLNDWTKGPWPWEVQGGMA